MQAPNLKVDRTVRRALSYARLEMPDIAKGVGRSDSTLRAYYSGKRRVPPAARARLAAFLDAHAEVLNDLADDLRVTA